MGDDNTGEATTQTDAKQKRFQSEIEFPYAEFESAATFAQTFREHAGTACEDAELAAWLNQSAISGTYRSRRSAARMFGLVEIAQGRVSLTELGSDAIEGPRARSEAFLRPALFRIMYEQFRGQTLPPPPAIERHMAQLGVSPKQTDRARQVFQKSAQYAGYIDQVTSRFVRPGNAADVDRQTLPERERGTGGGDGNGGQEIDPIILGLLARLPKSGNVWPETERKLWLGILENSFRLIYKDVSDDNGDKI